MVVIVIWYCLSHCSVPGAPLPLLMECIAHSTGQCGERVGTRRIIREGRLEVEGISVDWCRVGVFGLV